MDSGKALIWDVTVVDTLAQSYVIGCSSKSGYAANLAEEKKCRKYAELTGYHFEPIGFETFGAPGTAAEKFIEKLGKLVQNPSGEARSSEFLKQRISMDIPRGNAASVMGTLPYQKQLDEIFYVLSSERFSHTT